MIVLALNCGSSSLKFRLFQGEPDATLRSLAGGQVDRLGDRATIRFDADGGPKVDGHEAIRDQSAAVRRVTAAAINP